MSVQSAADADITAFPVIAAAGLATANTSTPMGTGCAITATSAMEMGRLISSVLAVHKARLPLTRDHPRQGKNNP